MFSAQEIVKKRKTNIYNNKIQQGYLDLVRVKACVIFLSESIYDSYRIKKNNHTLNYLTNMEKLFSYKQLYDYKKERG